MVPLGREEKSDVAVFFCGFLSFWMGGKLGGFFFFSPEGPLCLFLNLKIWVHFYRMQNYIFLGGKNVAFPPPSLGTKPFLIGFWKWGGPKKPSFWPFLPTLGEGKKGGAKVGKKPQKKGN